MTPDSELLYLYARTRSEEAFAELVRRHVNLVYSVVVRRLNGDTHLAQDAAQTVFADLARKAASLSRRATLTGWLYTSAHFASAEIARKESRRRGREEKYMREPDFQTATDPAWEELRPAIDEAMLQLKETDREAILLRYFENRPLAEVGAKLGLSENTARMRVERALEKLRALLAKRGIATTAALVETISAHAVQVAPAGMAAALAASSITAAGAETLTLLKIMTATKLKLGLGALLIVGATTALVVQHQTQNKLRAENEAWHRQVTQLQADNDALSNRLATAQDANPVPDRQLKDLLRLRAEVGLLRQKTNELGKLIQRDHLRRTEGDSQASEETTPDAETQRQISIAKMSDAKMLVLGEFLYAQDNKGQLATNLDQFASYLTNADQKLTGTNNFELAYTGSINGLTNPGSVIMMRESQAWPTLNGSWARSYGFMDGHAEVHVQESDDFDPFEQLHSLAPPTDQ
jgi:RNA polymerase sigma factor (sigma-70 family)